MESAITSSFFLGALVSLVVITNPLTKIPLFLSLTEGWSSGRRRSEAAHAALDAFFIMVASLVAGNSGARDDCRSDWVFNSDRGGGRPPDESRDVCRGDRGSGAFLLPHLGCHAGRRFLLKGAGSVRHPGPHQNHGFSSYFDRYSVRGIRNSYLLPKVTGGRFSGTFFSQINLA